MCEPALGFRVLVVMYEAIVDNEQYPMQIMANLTWVWLLKALKSVSARFLSVINVERRLITQLVDITVYFHTSIQVRDCNVGKVHMWTHRIDF
jgi:hypothetical protein